jgi:hypothetical protein
VIDFEFAADGGQCLDCVRHVSGIGSKSLWSP